MGEDLITSQTPPRTEFVQKCVCVIIARGAVAEVTALFGFVGSAQIPISFSMNKSSSSGI